MIPLGALAPIASKIGIRGFIGIGLVLALAFMWFRADSLSEQRDKWRAEVTAEQSRHAVTRASLDSLQARLTAMIADGKAREERQQEAVEAQREVSAGLERQIAAIRAQRPVPGPVGQCQSPESVLNADGL